MSEELKGFWKDDRWDIRKCPHPSAMEIAKRKAVRIRWVNFQDIENIWLKIELKYFFFYHIKNEIWSAQTVWIRKGTVIGRMLKFFISRYPDVKTITEIPIEKALSEYRMYLVKQGIRTTTTNYKVTAKQERIKVEANSYYITMLKQFMEFYEDYYFDGKELEKDVWDRRKLNLPKEKINPTQYGYLINFKGYKNHYFKEIVKRYCQLKLNTDSFSHVSDIAQSLRVFFNFLHDQFPHIGKIKQITRKIMEEYIGVLNEQGLASSTIRGKISAIQMFFSSIQRFDWEDIPQKTLIYPEDYPKMVRPTPRFIDDYVLEQLNKKLDKLPKYIATMVMIIQECGMRISELCSLKKDCLLQDKDGDYFLKYYQWKMKKDHIIPISKEVAELIQVHEKYTDPSCEYLFATKQGLPLKQDTFRTALNDLAVEEEIVDRQGKVFRFHAHAFRHTVGTKMINNGVPQHIVQKFLGHESPEMTSRYAHIFDETLKIEFEKFQERLVTKEGEFVDFEKGEVNTTDFQWFKKNINAQVLPNGYCRLPIVTGPCPHANACLDCTHFCTSKKFLKEHEEHLNRTEELLTYAMKNQWQRQIETNKRVKEKLEHIIHSLKETE
ncbi:tyrosine-type recombinase/integrase [Bacillus cereus]|uniref:tyrosine-type recombinase/integrase n=1 Tax=Bacillus cereus TaxID=1396 RepID=UPI003BFA672D